MSTLAVMAFNLSVFFILLALYLMFMTANAKRTFVVSTHGKTPYRTCRIVSNTEKFQLENNKVNDLFYPVWILIDFLCSIFFYFPFGLLFAHKNPHMIQTVKEEFTLFWAETKNKKRIVWDGVVNSVVLILAIYDLSSFLIQLAELE